MTQLCLCLFVHTTSHVDYPRKYSQVPVWLIRRACTHSGENMHECAMPVTYREPMRADLQCSRYQCSSWFLQHPFEFLKTTFMYEYPVEYRCAWHRAAAFASQSFGIAFSAIILLQACVIKIGVCKSSYVPTTMKKVLRIKSACRHVQLRARKTRKCRQCHHSSLFIRSPRVFCSLHSVCSRLLCGHKHTRHFM